MDKSHTIIIGAGPGGLACAEALARQNIEVLVLEKKERIGPKVCAGGVTGSGLLQGLPADLIERSFPAQRIVTPLQQFTLSSDTPIVSTVDRDKLGQWMLQRACQAGAKVINGETVQSIERDFLILRSGERIGFRFLVGADGSASLVRRHLGLPTKKVGVGIQYFLPTSLKEMEWHLDVHRFACGYAWIFPHQKRTSLGAYVPAGGMRPHDLQSSCREWAAARGIELVSLKPEAGRINYDYQGWRFDNIFLVGDAAGLASGLTGEGIYPAIVSGKTVANTILNGQYRSRQFLRLLKNHQRHSRLVALTSKSRMFSRLAMEALVLSLRMGLIDFKIMEMAVPTDKGSQ